MFTKEFLHAIAESITVMQQVLTFIDYPVNPPANVLAVM